MRSLPVVSTGRRAGHQLGPAAFSDPRRHKHVWRASSPLVVQQRALGTHLLQSIAPRRTAEPDHRDKPCLMSAGSPVLACTAVRLCCCCSRAPPRRCSFDTLAPQKAIRPADSRPNSDCSSCCNLLIWCSFGFRFCDNFRCQSRAPLSEMFHDVSTTLPSGLKIHGLSCDPLRDTSLGKRRRGPPHTILLRSDIITAATSTFS